jgi:hypothetical protein
MSTDYGLKCKQCDKSIVPDNMRSYDIDYIVKHLPDLVALGKAHNALRAYIYITTHWCDNFNDFLDWIVAHETHPLVVVDEYGDEHEP